MHVVLEISGALHLAQPGLTAGRQADRQAGRLADEIQVNFEIFKVDCKSKYDLSFCLTKVQHHYSLINAFQPVFRVKPIARLIFKAQNFPKAVQFPTNPYY